MTSRLRWRPNCAIWATALLSSLSACDGPNEQAGREKDRAEAMAAGQNVTGEGPNELEGEAQDRVESADRKATEAAADALEARADQMRSAADIEADKLDDQAQAMREGPTQ